MTKELTTQEQEMAIVPASNGLFFNVQKFELAQRVANVFASSTMVPDHFKNNIGNCLIALNLADRMQCDPFMLLQNMYIVHGKPGIEAKLAIALVNASGKFSPIQYEFNADRTECVAYAKRTNTGEECRSVPVSLDMAKAEGWMSKPGSKWKTMPELMLQYRAAMFFARAYCPESLLGMQSREELHDTYDMVPGAQGYEITPQATTDLESRLTSPKNGIHGHMMTGTDRDLGKTKEPEPVEDPTIESLGWNPYQEEVMGRYVPEKKRLLEILLEKDGVEFNPNWAGPQLHRLLLDKAGISFAAENPEPEPEPEPESEFVEPVKTTIVPADKADAHLAAEEYHSLDELAAMPRTLQHVYADIASEMGMQSEALSPKAVNTALKHKFPAQWKSAQAKLGFGGFPATLEAADLWNLSIVKLVDDGMMI